MPSPRKNKPAFTFKKLIGQVHLWLGLASGLVVLVVALTGCILVFEEELEPVIYRKQMVVEAKPEETRFTVDALMAIAQKEYPGAPVRQVRLEPAADRSTMVMLGNGKRLEQKYVFVNPYTGKVLGKGNIEDRFFSVVTNLHRYLLAGSTGKIITGISCSMFVILTISGMVIWWPANKNAAKQRFSIKWNGSFKRVNWDIHAVFGFYTSFFLIAISVTGLVWSYEWVNNLIYTLADGKKTKAPVVVNKAPLTAKNSQVPGLYQSVYKATDKVYPFHGKTFITLPAADSVAIAVVKYDEEAVVSNKASTVWFDAGTGAQLQTLPYGKLSQGNKVRRLVYPIHTGSIYGWPTKILAFFVSLFAASLPVTGLFIYLGRKKKVKKKAPLQPAKREPGVAALQPAAVS